MCYTGRCRCEDYWGDCTLPDSSKCIQLNSENFLLKEKKEQEFFEKKLKDIIIFLLKELNIEFSLKKKKFVYNPDCMNIMNYKTGICYDVCKKIQKCEKYFNFLDKLNEGVIEDTK